MTPEQGAKTDRTALRVLLAGGGTGGHLFPGLAVAQEVRRSGGEALFVGTPGGLESSQVPRAGFALELIRVQPLKRVTLLTRLQSFALMPGAIWNSSAILKRFRPHVAVGLGGYASGPVMLAAWLKRIPVVLLEQNTVPGLTNRILSRLARKVVIAFPEAAGRFPSGRSELCGNPVRQSLVEAVSDRSPEPSPGGQFVLLVLGGSQGARALNELMMEAVPGLMELDLHIIHQTGPADADRVEEAYRKAGMDATVRPFIDDMASVYKESRLALCRAGATTIAELAVAGLPALLVPFPYAADDHQTLNAQAVSATGGAVVLPQAQLTAQRLLDEIRTIKEDRERIQSMGQAMRTFGKPEAARAVKNLLERVAGLGSN